MENFRVEESLGHLVAKVHQLFSHYFREKLIAFHLTPPQFGTLAFLWRHDGISQVELANRLRKDKNTISEIIDRLEKENLVVRKSSPDDRRLNFVFLTPRGAGLRETLEKIAIESTLEITAALEEEERELLRSLLKKILESAGGERTGFEG